MRVQTTIAAVAVAACSVGLSQPAAGGDDGYPRPVYIHHFVNHPVRVARVFRIRHWVPRYLHVYHTAYPFRGMGPTYDFARYRYLYQWREEHARW
jgi:hypothetical protein